MRWGSVTSVGVAYPLSLEVPDLASHVAALIGPVIRPAEDGNWLLRLVGSRDVSVDLGLNEENGSVNTRLIEQFLGANYAELEGRVLLTGIGEITAVLRPETRHASVLLDLADADLFPEDIPERSELVMAALRELLLKWYDASHFAVAFADHEAEFDVDIEALDQMLERYALVAEPNDRPGGAPLRFHQAGWQLSALGT
jgi:hypothetical protein